MRHARRSAARFPLEKKRKGEGGERERKKGANGSLCVCAGSRVTWLHGYERCSRIGASAQSGDSCRANNGQGDGNRYGNPESRANHDSGRARISAGSDRRRSAVIGSDRRDRRDANRFAASDGIKSVRERR